MGFTICEKIQGVTFNSYENEPMRNIGSHSGLDKSLSSGYANNKAQIILLAGTGIRKISSQPY